MQLEGLEITEIKTIAVRLLEEREHLIRTSRVLLVIASQDDGTW